MAKNPLGLWVGVGVGAVYFWGFTHLTDEGNAFQSTDLYKRYSVKFDEYYDPYSYRDNRYVGPVNLVRWDND